MKYGSEASKTEAIYHPPSPLATEKLASYERKLQQAAKRQQTHLRQKTATELREMLKRKALILYFEPIICTKTMKTTGANAVLRLQRQGFGLIPAEHILTMAEDSAILTEIGCWMAKQILRWGQKCPEDFVFTLKVSPHQLFDYKFTACIINTLNQNNTARNHLALMLASDDWEQPDEDWDGVLQMLAGNGVTFSIRHTSHEEQTNRLLETGFFSTLILDKHIVIAMTQDRAKYQNLIKLIEKAQSCQYKTRVTGIDSAAQVMLCREIGIDEMQGSFIGPAVKLAALQSRVRLPID